MISSRPFSANTNKLAYAQAFSRTSTRRSGRASNGSLRRSLFALRTRRHAI